MLKPNRTMEWPGNSERIYGVVVQPDGKIVAAGRAHVYRETSVDKVLVVARYDTLGGLDPGFGSGGVVTTQISNFDVWHPRPESVLIQPQADGTSKIVVAGWAMDVSLRRYILLARYNPDGTLDGSFGVSGARSASAPSAATLTDAALADARHRPGDGRPCRLRNRK